MEPTSFLLGPSNGPIGPIGLASVAHEKDPSKEKRLRTVRCEGIGREENGSTNTKKALPGKLTYGFKVWTQIQLRVLIRPIAGTRIKLGVHPY